METKYYKIGSGDDCAAFAEAGEIICRGGLVAFPTETVYGLGGNALCAESARRIYEAKGRPGDNPLIVHVADPVDAGDFAGVNGVYGELSRLFMPGPLTVILPKKDIVPDETTGGLPTVAVRCPSNPAARALIEAAGVPIAAPSANLSGRPSPTSAAHVAADLDGRIDMILDGGECEIGLESTVIAVTPDGVNVLRPGAVTPEMLRQAGFEVSVAEAVTRPDRAGDHPASPGMKYKHYAPRAPLTLVDGDRDDLLFAASRAKTKGGRVAVMCSTDDLPFFADFIVLDTGRSDGEYAHRFFSLLRKADNLKAEAIFAGLPSTDGISLALYNRIIRSAGGNVISVRRDKEK